MIHTIRGFMNRLSEDHVGAYAAQSAYFMLLSFFPFVMLMVTMVRYTPLTSTMLSNALVNAFPPEFRSFILAIVSEIFTRSSAFLPFSIVAALWSAGKGVNALTNGLNTIYHVKETRGYVMNRIRGTFYTLIFLIALVMTLVLLIFGNTIQQHLSSRFIMISRITSFIISMRTLLTFGVLVILFLLIYKFIPNRKASFRSQVPGAMISAVAWLAFSLGFSLYLDLNSGFSNMYGSLTTVVLLMLWLYFCMWILLIGAEINAYFEDKLRKLQNAAIARLEELRDK